VVGAGAVRSNLLDQQRLWFCRWGTMIALVWAQSAENAERRVRHQVFDRRATLQEVTAGAVFVHGEVFVREATEADKEVYVEWGGRVPA
jgi:hypothetical protein